MQKNTNLNSKILTLAESIVPDIIYRSKLKGIKEVPNWESHLEYDFSKDIPVSHDSYYIDFGSRNTGKFMHIMKELYPNYNIIDSGHYYYPKTGYMGWHTNSNKPCKRVYIVYSDGQSFFRYKQGNDIITDYDNIGITVREFDIPELPEQLWHCVGSYANRFSFGFRLE